MRCGAWRCAQLSLRSWTDCVPASPETAVPKSKTDYNVIFNQYDLLLEQLKFSAPREKKFLVKIVKYLPGKIVFIQTFFPNLIIGRSSIQKQFFRMR
jgi:hypothetical protein